MSRLGEILGDVQSTRQVAHELVLNSEKLAHQRILDLRDRVLDGERTNLTALEAGVVALWGDYLVSNPEIAENYQKIADQLPGKKGEPLIVVQRRLERVEYDSTYTEHAIATTVAMGRLSSSKINFYKDKKTASLPTSAYALESDSSIRLPQLYRGKFKIDSRIPDLTGLDSFSLAADYDRPLNFENKKMRFSMADHARPLLAMEVMIGYDGITDWMEGQEDQYSRSLVNRSIGHMAPLLFESVTIDSVYLLEK